MKIEYFKNLLMLSNYHNMQVEIVLLWQIGMTAVCQWNICDNFSTQTRSAVVWFAVLHLHLGSNKLLWAH